MYAYVLHPSSVNARVTAFFSQYLVFAEKVHYIYIMHMYVCICVCVCVCVCSGYLVTITPYRVKGLGGG